MKTVLIVDDEVSLREVLVDLLEDEGYQVVTAGDGEEALERLTDVHPDLIVSDLMMPGMGGLELCRVLQSHPDLAAIPFVILTASRRPAIGSDCAYRALIVKPFEVGQLLSTIAKLVNSPEG